MSAAKQLEQIVRDRRMEPSRRLRNNQAIVDNVLMTSPHLTDANFESIHPDDILLLFELYDEYYFEGSLQRTVHPQPISFRLSRRMTRAGGKTTRWSDRSGRKPNRYEIAVSTTLLFQSFQDPERKVTVTGLECDHRLDGLMRIMEHEVVHLIEMLLWDGSSCAQHRFQTIASGLFGHRDHRHDLITPGEVAVTQYGIRPGVRVRFDHEGHRLEGVVNRITKRATVLVVHPNGDRYSDGQRYVKFYVPVSQLESLES